MSKDDLKLAIRRKERRSAEIAAFAAKNAGTNLDLDRDLEEAGIEVIEAAVETEHLGPRHDPAQTKGV